MTAIRVVVADDHRYVHEAVTNILNTVSDIEVVADAGNGKEAIELCDEFHPDVVLMDVVMPLMDGIEATQIIHQRFPEIRVIVLSSYQDHESIWATLRNGASGYILKGTLTQDLIGSIRTVFRGQAVLSADVAAQLLNPDQSVHRSRFNLTNRELEVLELMAEGLSNTQIARELCISVSTVKFHIANTLSKLNVQTRAEALVVAARNNLI